MERTVQELLSYRIGVEAGHFFSGGIHQSLHRSTSFAKKDVDCGAYPMHKIDPDSGFIIAVKAIFRKTSNKARSATFSVAYDEHFEKNHRKTDRWFLFTATTHIGILNITIASITITIGIRHHS